MKSKIKLLIAMLFISITTMAQSPNMINYQGVARNTNGSAIANQNIKVRLKVRQGTATGTVKYSEVRSLTTDASGLFTIQIGSAGASIITGSWGAIKWETGAKFLRVEMDPTGGNNFIDMGTQQLLSVPYAMHAKQASAFAPNAYLPISQIDTAGGILGGFLRYDGTSWVSSTLLPFNQLDGNINSFAITNNCSIGGNAIYGMTTTNSVTAAGVKGESNKTNGNGVYGKATGVSAFAVLGENTTGVGVKGKSNGGSNSAGVYGENTGALGNGVYGVANSASAVGVYGNSNNGIGLEGYSNGGTGVFGSVLSGTAIKGYSYTGYGLDINGKVKIAGGNTTPGAGKILTSDAAGNATWQTPTAEPKIAFRVSGETAQTFSDNNYVKTDFQIEEYDLSNNFQAYAGSSTGTSSVFTAPLNGVYNFSSGVHFYIVSNTVSFNSVQFYLKVESNGVTKAIAKREAIINNTLSTCEADTQIDTDIYLAAGDKVYVVLKQFNGSGVAYSMSSADSECYFSGHLVTTY